MADRKLLSLHDILSEYGGFTYSHLYKLVVSGELPAIRVGRRVVVKRVVWEQFLKAREVAS